jgi:hypothetical protein
MCVIPLIFGLKSWIIPGFSAYQYAIYGAVSMILLMIVNAK